MKSKQILTGIKGYLRSTLPLYKLAKNSRFMTKNISILTDYTCFEAPAYFSPTYNLAYRLQAYAESVNYISKSKSHSVWFDFGAKKLTKQDSTAFFKIPRCPNYGKLDKTGFYQLFPSMHRPLITQQLISSATIAYLNNQNCFIVGSEPWFHSKLKPVIHRKKNYLFPSKLLSEELDQLISKFDPEWASILKTKSSAYCLTTSSSYFSFMVDADLNWDSLPYQFFRYYDVLLSKTRFLTKKFYDFWASLTTGLVSLNNFITNMCSLVITQIKYNLNTKLSFNIFPLNVVRFNKSGSYISTVYINNFFVSLLASLLCNKLILSTTWIFNKLNVLYQGTKMLFEPGLTLLVKTKTVLPRKCLNFIEALNEFFFQPTDFSYGTSMFIVNDNLVLRKMTDNILNKKFKYNFTSVTNISSKNIISKLTALELPTRTVNLLKKLNFSIENLSVRKFNLKHKLLISNANDLQFLPIRMQLLMFPITISSWWKSNLQFLLPNLFDNLNKWLYIRFKKACNLIYQYCKAYNKVLRSMGRKWKWKLNCRKVVIASFFFFFTKKKPRQSRWKKFWESNKKELNFIYNNYHLFRWFHKNLFNFRVIVRKTLYNFVKRSSLKNLRKILFLGKLVQKVRINKLMRVKNLIYPRRFKRTKLKPFPCNPYKILKIYRLKSKRLPMEVEPVFSKYDSFADSLKTLTVSKSMVRRLKYPKKYSKKKESKSAKKNKKKNKIKPKRKRSHKKKKKDNNVIGHISIIESIPLIKKDISPGAPPSRQQPAAKAKTKGGAKGQSGCPNPNYKGNNYDPQFRKKNKKAARAERAAAKALNNLKNAT